MTDLVEKDPVAVVLIVLITIITLLQFVRGVIGWVTRIFADRERVAYDDTEALLAFAGVHLNFAWLIRDSNADEPLVLLLCDALLVAQQVMVLSHTYWTGAQVKAPFDWVMVSLYLPAATMAMTNPPVDFLGVCGFYATIVLCLMKLKNLVYFWFDNEEIRPDRLEFVSAILWGTLAWHSSDQLFLRANIASACTSLAEILSK